MACPLCRLPYDLSKKLPKLRFLNEEDWAILQEELENAAQNFIEETLEEKEEQEFEKRYGALLAPLRKTGRLCSIFVFTVFWGFLGGILYFQNSSLMKVLLAVTLAGTLGAAYGHANPFKSKEERILRKNFDPFHVTVGE